MPQRLEAAHPLARLLGQEPLEDELVGRQARDDERGDRCRRSGHHLHRDARVDAGAHEPVVARVGDGGVPLVAHEGHVVAVPEARQQPVDASRSLPSKYDTSGP